MFTTALHHGSNQMLNNTVNTMSSLDTHCNELKKQYDACFNSWFTERYLKGHHDDDTCAPLFKIYQECVKKAMQDQKIELREIKSDYNTEAEYHKRKNTS